MISPRMCLGIESECMSGRNRDVGSWSLVGSQVEDDETHM